MLRNRYRALKASGGWRWVDNGCSPRNQGAGGEHEDLFMAAKSLRARYGFLVFHGSINL